MNYVIDYPSMFQGISRAIAVAFVLYIVPYLIKRGWEHGKLAAHTYAQDMIKEAYKQGHENGHKCERGELPEGGGIHEK